MIFLACLVLAVLMAGGTWLVTGDGLAVVVAFLVWIATIWIIFMILSVTSKRRVGYRVNAPEESVMRVVRSSFGTMWRETSGPATLNFQARGLGVGIRSPGKHPTLSIQIDATSNGVEVEVWMSNWFSQKGMVLSVDRVAYQRFRLRRALASIEPITEPTTAI